MTTWDGLLWATGGLLELEKFFFCLAMHRFNDDGSVCIETPEENGAALTINRRDGTSATTPQKSPDDTHELLGTKKSPTGNQKPKLNLLAKKSNQHARLVNTGGLSHVNASVAHC